jgi:hypothetical protein
LLLSLYSHIIFLYLVANDESNSSRSKKWTNEEYKWLSEMIIALPRPVDWDHVVECHKKHFPHRSLVAIRKKWYALRNDDDTQLNADSE